MVIEKLNNLDASDILTRTTFDEVPDGYRESVFVEEDENGILIDTWFVGPEGAISYRGMTLTLKEWRRKII